MGVYSSSQWVYPLAVLGWRFLATTNPLPLPKSIVPILPALTFLTLTTLTTFVTNTEILNCNNSINNIKCTSEIAEFEEYCDVSAARFRVPAD